ncbi:MAG: methionyl-tRNA formyltransferase [Myxococcales bacterium]|nr:methionyl-tRNA formyltransferase [Myxococcales bacterium]
MGTPDFAVPTLNALVEAGHELVLVVAQPDRPSGRGKKLKAPAVAVRATELGLPLAQPRALRKGPFPERYVGLQADVGVVIAYGRILPERLLDSPAHSCVNVHASLLPRWRGAAPIQHAILAGDTVTGVCTQRMEPSLDTGPVYVREQTPIGERETSGELHDRLAQMSARVAVRTLEILGTSEPEPQPEEGITWAPKIAKADGEIDFAQPARQLDLRIRAMTPWPGGWTTWRDGPLKLKVAVPVEGSGAPGTVLSADPLVVACGEGALHLVTVQAPGRRPVDGADFARGLRLQPGDPL